MNTIRSATLAVVLCAAASRAALAQQAPAPSGATTAPAAGDTQLQEVVVTAQRRSENLQSVPIAVTALSAARLQANGISSTQGLSSVTPALTFSDVAGFVEPRIRGIGNASAGPAVENEVATYVDGVYISSAPGSLMSLSNVERVETLKGPQGTLFGRNATGGVIQIITKDPSQQFGGNAAFSVDNYDTVRTDLYLTGPVTQDVAANLSVSLAHQGLGYGKNLDTGDPTYRTDRDIAVSSKWLFHLGEATTIRLSVDGSQRFGSDPDLSELGGTAPASYKTGLGVPIIEHISPWDTNNYYDTWHKTQSAGAALRIDQRLGELTLTSITAYRGTQFDQQFDANFSPVGATPEDEIYVQRDRQVSEEVQLAPTTQDGRLKWLVGLYYFDLKSAYDPLDITLGAPPAQHDLEVLQDRLGVQSIAGYGQATYEILPGTNLTAGFRYTGETRTIDWNLFTTAANVGAKKLTEGTPTWRIAVDHKFAPDVLGYVSYNRGYKSGGFNPASPTAPAYLPEYLDAYEVGIKSELFDRRIRINAAIFDYQYQNIQVNTYIGSLGVIYNGAQAQTYGLDADFDFKLTDDLTLSGGLDLLHDRFTNFPKAVISHPTGLGTVTQAPGSATGNRLPFAPDATVSLGVDYKHPLAQGTVDVSINDLYSTGYYTQPDNYLRQGAYHMLNGSVTWRSPGDVYSIQVFANNMLNAAVADYLAASTTAIGVSYLPPQIYGVRFGVNF